MVVTFKSIEPLKKVNRCLYFELRAAMVQYYHYLYLWYDVEYGYVFGSKAAQKIMIDQYNEFIDEAECFLKEAAEIAKKEYNVNIIRSNRCLKNKGLRVYGQYVFPHRNLDLRFKR